EEGGEPAEDEQRHQDVRGDVVPRHPGDGAARVLRRLGLVRLGLAHGRSAFWVSFFSGAGAAATRSFMPGMGVPIWLVTTRSPAESPALTRSVLGSSHATSTGRNSSVASSVIT